MKPKQPQIICLDKNSEVHKNFGFFLNILTTKHPKTQKIHPSNGRRAGGPLGPDLDLFWQPCFYCIALPCTKWKKYGGMERRQISARGSWMPGTRPDEQSPLFYQVRAASQIVGEGVRGHGKRGRRSMLPKSATPCLCIPKKYSCVNVATRKKDNTKMFDPLKWAYTNKPQRWQRVRTFLGGRGISWE